MKLVAAIAGCALLVALELAVVVLSEPETPEEEWERHRWWQRPM